MRSTYLASLIVLSVLNGCTKIKEGESAFRYTVNNVHDVTVKKGENVSLQLEVKHLEGTQKEVSLGVKGLPNPVLIEFTSDHGVPNYNTRFTLTATTHSVPGRYPIQIMGSCKDQEPQYYDMAVTVTQ